MSLLLTILSVLALWALLGVLIIGLLLILRALQSVRGSMEKITMGVRAIERQTVPLGGHADTLAGSLVELGGALRTADARLAMIEPSLTRASPALRTR